MGEEQAVTDIGWVSSSCVIGLLAVLILNQLTLLTLPVFDHSHHILDVVDPPRGISRRRHLK